MVSKRRAAIILGSLTIMGALCLFFFYGRADQKHVSPNSGNTYFVGTPLQYPSQEKTGRRLDVSTEQMTSQKEAWHGVLLAIDDVRLYAPENGKLQLEVRKGARVRLNDILGEIKSEKTLGSHETQKSLFKEEISMKGLDIEIALEDIGNLETEIDDTTHKLYKASYTHNNAQVDYDSGLINEKALREKKEELEQLGGHLEAAEAMLSTKYNDIDEYEGRIEELRRTVRELENDFVLKAPFDGIVSKILVESGQYVNKETPLIELKPLNLLSIQVKGKIPFSLNGKKVQIAFEDKTSKQYVGTLRIERFVASKNEVGGQTVVNVILEQHPSDVACDSGRVVKLFQ